jgi:hypothetical protein
MPYGIFADIVVLIHLGFVVFALLGGLLIFWRRWMIWLHLPALFWAVWIECMGGICPLTYLENWLRLKGGQGGYRGDFIGSYILPILYPADITRRMQFILAILVIVINISIYGTLVYRHRRGSG